MPVSVFNACRLASLLLLSLVVTISANAQSVLELQVGSTHRVSGGKTCTGGVDSFTVDHDLPPSITLNTESVTLVNGLTVRIKFDLIVAIDAPLETHSVSIEYTLNRPSGSCIKTFDFDITVTMALPPVADFGADQLTALAGAQIEFEDLSDNAVSEWLWSFGDGQVSADVSPTHSYENPGIYTVSLTVTGPAGQDFVEKQDLIEIVPAGTPGFIAWEFSTEDGFTSTPALGPDGNVVFGGGIEDWHLYSVDAAGSLNWRYLMGIDSVGPPVIDTNGRIYAGSAFGDLRAVSSSGDEIWRFAVSSPNGVVNAPVLGADGVIFAHDQDGTVYAVDGNGEEIWSLFVGGGRSASCRTSMTLGDGAVYVAADQLHKITTNGESLWTFDPGIFLAQTAPAIDYDGSAIFGTRSGRVYRISEDGEEVWNFGPPQLHNFFSPVIGPRGIIYVVGEKGSSSTLYALTPDGVEQWSFEMPGERTGVFAQCARPTIDADGLIYVPNPARGDVYAVTSNGQQRWLRETVPGQRIGGLALGQSRLYVGGSTAELFAITIERSERVFSHGFEVFGVAPSDASVQTRNWNVGDSLQ